MKHTVAFIIILAAVLLLGFYSADIAGLLFNDDKLEHMSIDRDRDASGAIYVTSENETSFDPMELVKDDEPYSCKFSSCSQQNYARNSIHNFYVDRLLK